MLEETTVYAYVLNFVLIGLFCRPLAAKNPKFCRFFGLRHLVVLPIGGNLRKVNMIAHLQIFPYPMVSKSFPYSSAFMATSGAQTLTFNSVTDTDRQIKLNVFGAPEAGEI